MTAARPTPMRPGAVAVAAVLAFEGMALALVAVRGGNIGFDFQAYARAAQRILDGAPVYDLSVKVAGDFAAFFYPPPFAVAFIPFAVLPHLIGLWQWEALAIGSIGVGVAILPVSARVRWLTLALCVIDWPVLYSILLSQVGPLLFLLFAVGWRWRDKPVVLAVSMAAGALVKIQPIILLGWAALTGRWRALAIALGVDGRRRGDLDPRSRAGRLVRFRRARRARLIGDDAEERLPRRDRLPGGCLGECGAGDPAHDDGRRGGGRPARDPHGIARGQLSSRPSSRVRSCRRSSGITMPSS